MTINEMISVFSLLFTLIAVLFTARNSKRTDTKDLEERVAENTRFNIKLDNIAQDVAETKEEIKLQRREVQNLVERMAKVEASASQAHKRLDILNGEIHNDKKGVRT